MFVTNHVLIGSFIGLALPRRPASAFCAGVVSHYVCDSTPHWGIEPNPPRFLKYAIVDGLIGLATLSTIGSVTPARRRLAVVAGMLGAAFPDADKPSELFFHRSPFPRAADAFHARIQRESPNGLTHEIAFAGALAGVLVLLRRRAR